MHNDSALSWELEFQRTHSISNAEANPNARSFRKCTAARGGRAVSNNTDNCAPERETEKKLPVPCQK